MSDIVNLDEIPSDLPLLSIDERFTQLIKDSIERDVSAGQTPESAAVRAGLSVRIFRSLLKKYDQFADWVEGLKLLQCGNLRVKTMNILGELEETYPAKAAELYMKFLSGVDEEFGTQRTKADNRHEIEVVPPSGHVERQENILRESEARIEENEVPSV